MAKPLPGLDVPVAIDPKTGNALFMTQTWFDFFSSRQKLSQFPDVSQVSPTNGQVLIWNDTSKLYVPGAN